MNIAFPAVLIILLALPGVIFNRRRSVSGRFRSQRQILDEIFPSLGVACAAHLVWVLGCYLLSGQTGLFVDTEAVLLLAAGRTGAQQHSVEAIQAISDHPVAVFLYFSTLLVACYYAGSIYRRYLLRQGGAVRALTMFSAEDESQARRFAEWAQVLPLDLPAESVACTTIVASVTVGSQSYLYAGMLKKVFWNETTGEPEWFQLSSTLRREIAADRTPADNNAERWYTVEGESFLIRFSEVDTLNLIYSALEEASDNRGEPNSTGEPVPEVVDDAD